MEIRLLGPLEVRDGERTVALPRRQQRALLAALALRAGEVVSTDRLVADLWGERAPPTAIGSLQNTVHALRKALGRDLVLTKDPGYRLALAPESVDAHRFEELRAAARGADEAERASLLHEALALWRGPALADLDEEQSARLGAARLDELRVAAQEERIDAELALGRHASLVGELEALVAAHAQPPRERLYGQLMLTLYRCGRQGEALEVYQALRLALADELGLDPSPELQKLHRRILQQDPLLDPPAQAPAASVPERAERRLVTVLAVIPPADDDPERHRRLLDETIATVQDALARNRGTLERSGPEGVVAIFGAETSSDDDAHRAVATAAELGLPAGIATGEIVGRAGQVINRAVELARSEGITLDERTTAIVGESRRLDTPLVGRQEELAQLTAALKADACRVVTVVGEPGIGKTRLARELALQAGDDTAVLVARCVSYGEGAAFLPLLDALRHTEHERALEGEEDAELVQRRLAALAGGEETVSLGESYWAVRRLLEALAPALLILDDVHWAEPALLDLVDYLGERTTSPLLVLCLTRPELERSFGELLRLDPLDDEHARELVPPQLDEETTKRIVELAEGNPLYVEQLASYAAEGGEGLPPTLEAVLAGRLGRLDPPERAVLQRAAVVGREFSLGAVTALADGDIARDLIALSRAGFVHAAATADPADDGYTFHHVLLRDTAYTSLTKADRADLHERTALWLDRNGPGDDALVGYHLEQAVGYRRELGEDADELAAIAGERLGEAGMRVWRVNDVAAAAGLLGRAVALLPPGQRRAELNLERSLALRLGNRSDEAEQAWTDAERDAHAAGSKPMQARVECERVQTQLLSGDLTLDRAVAALANIIPELQSATDARGLARAEIVLSNVHWFACRLDELGASAARAERHYLDAGFSGGTAVGMQAEVLYFGATPVPRAIELCTELLERIPDGAAQATATTVLGALLSLQGNADARSLLASARSLYEEIGNESALLTTWTPYFVEVEALVGDPALATATGRASIEQLLATGDVAYASSHAVLLAYVLLDLGDNDGADEYVRLAEEEALPSDVYAQFMWRGARARLLASEGKMTDAEDLARDAVRIATLTDALREQARVHIALADVLQLSGKSKEARAEMTTARRLLRQKGASALLEKCATPALSRP